jgi:glycosyltransferase involved in cell wall biosynthesis
MKVAIRTTTHWQGDARLNRHARYLRNVGHDVQIISHHGLPRWRAMWRTLVGLSRGVEEVVILPDPEIYFLGSVVARSRRKRVIVDIHEDYPAVVAGRERIPPSLRPLARLIARVLVGAGRATASKVMVAAPHLALAGESVVRNTPDPADFAPPAPPGPRLTYVGDITLARGALEMVEAIAQLDEPFSLDLIGGADPETQRAVITRAGLLGVEDRVTLAGRLEHEAAWTRARGAVAGLSLLRDLPAYRDAVATKLWEYMSAGIPPLVTDLPAQAAVARDIDPDLVCLDARAVATAARRLLDEPERRSRIVARGQALSRQAWEEGRPDLAIQRVVEP